MIETAAGPTPTIRGDRDQDCPVASGQPLLVVRGVSKSYMTGFAEVPVLKNVGFEIGQGEFVALMGSSGSGKTTLMNILGCLDRPSGGSYHLAGQNVGTLRPEEMAALRARCIGFVFQTFNLLPRMNALQNVLMPRVYVAESLTEDATQRARDLLERLGLGGREMHDPSQLSGGQQQRVAIARALINQPILLLADEPTGNLDSVTSTEVLKALRRLNSEDGMTIVLVTHEEAVAACADRIIRLHDGDVIEDGGAKQPVDIGPAASSVRVRRSDTFALTDHSVRWGQLLQTAMGALRRNKMRAGLTTLGIVIGIAAVIAMMEIGRGSATAIRKTIATMGANNVLVLPGTASSGGVSYGAGSVMTLTPEDSVALATETTTLKAVAPIVRARAQVVYGDRNWVPISIIGTTPAYLDVRDWRVANGEAFTVRDVRNGNKVCLIGRRLVEELFAGTDPVGKELRVQNVPFVVVGVLAPKGANMMGMDQDDILIAPWSTLKSRVSNSGSGTALLNAPAQPTPDPAAAGRLYPGLGSTWYPPRVAGRGDDSGFVRAANVDQIVAAAKDAASIPLAIDEINSILRTRHRIRSGKQDDFNVRDMAEMSSIVTSTAAVMTNLLLAVSLISLVVGGVGIMNIMLVSVTERTREIGLRMAVGARSGDVLQQFLLESVVLCLVGGLVGIALGRTISTVIRGLLHWPIELSWDAILTAFIVAVVVGLVFGFYPAWKAARQNPIVALRYE